jgi:hypothetical protein
MVPGTGVCAGDRLPVTCHLASDDHYAALCIYLLIPYICNMHIDDSMLRLACQVWETAWRHNKKSLIGADGLEVEPEQRFFE